MYDTLAMKKLALQIRINVLKMLAYHSHGHVGGSLSVADAIGRASCRERVCNDV